MVAVAALVVAGLTVGVAIVVDRHDDGSEPVRGRRVAAGAVRPDEPVLRWRHERLVGTILAGPRLVASDGGHVFVASGFADSHSVRALDRGTGEVVWTTARPSTTFLQGVVGDVVVTSGQYETVTGLDVGTGAERWEIDLRTIELDGYGADVSAAIDDLLVIGLSGHGEGDVRAPVVIGVDVRDGAVRWRATLEPGTDLMWGEPLIVDGAAVLLSTLSNPTSAPGNVAHAVDLHDGSVRWTVPLGGVQGFRPVSPVASEGRVHLPAQFEIITVDAATGTELWRRPAVVPVLLARGPELVVLEAGQLGVVDAATGEPRSTQTLAAPSEPPMYALGAFDDDAVLVLDRTQVRAVDPRDGAQRWRSRWASPPISVPAIDTELLVTTAADGSVSAYDLPARRRRGPAEPTPTPAPTAPAAGVFSSPTDTVLLFTDGIDGVTAVDLDRRIAGRTVIDGERAGDQQFRLTLTGDHLVVGWGGIHAAPLAGGPSVRIDDATISVPAAEPGEVWTVTWDGGRIGSGEPTVRRVHVDGTVSLSTDALDARNLPPLLGVPGGLVVPAPGGIAVWDASTGTLGPTLGPGPGVTITSNGELLAWCESSCATTHVVELERPGAPTAPHVSAGSQQLAFSPDGRRLAALRPVDGDTRLVVTDLDTGDEAIVATSLDGYGALQWTDDGEQLFYTENAYRQPSTRIGRYTVADADWELRTIPVGDGLAAIAITPEQARHFLDAPRVDPTACPGANGSFPSGRTRACTFAF